MQYPPLNNYLRPHRRELELLQREVAFLLCGGNAKSAEGTLVSRHELGKSVPDLETAMAYASIYDTPVSDLFAGRFVRIEAKVAQRARLLLPKVEETSCPRKVEVLQALASKRP